MILRIEKWGDVARSFITGIAGSPSFDDDFVVTPIYKNRSQTIAGVCGSNKSRKVRLLPAAEGTHQWSHKDFALPDNKPYAIEVINTWEMAVNLFACSIFVKVRANLLSKPFRLRLLSEAV